MKRTVVKEFCTQTFLEKNEEDMVKVLDTLKIVMKFRDDKHHSQGN